MGLRGEAAIVGIAELPARDASRARRRAFTLDQYARAGQDGDRGRRAGPAVGGQRTGHARHRRSRTCSPRRPCRSTWACPWTSVSASTSAAPPSAGMVWRAAVAVELGICDAVLASCRGRLMLPRSQRAPDARAPALVRRVEQQVRIAAGRVRDPLRQRRAERAVRPDRAAVRRASSATTRAALAKIAVDQRTNACAHPGRGVPRQAADHRRRARQPGDRRPDPHARDRDARPGRRGVLIANADLAAAVAASPGVDQGLRRAHRVQDTDLRRRPGPHADRAGRRAGVRDGGPGAGPTSTWPRSTTATRSPC